MKALIQRVKSASVTIEGELYSSINAGLLVFVGVTKNDIKENAERLAQKILSLRIFEDENEKMNLSILDTKGSILSISQFTLYANCTEGRRPSFVEAMNPTEASRLYDVFNEKLREFLHVETGIFGADMKVEIYNDGPVTICLDSDVLFKKGVK